MRKAGAILRGGIARCVFSTDFMRTVDNRVDNLWKTRGEKAPFGDFRRSWWRYHCKELGGGPDLCPYEPRDCAAAFLRVAELSVNADRPGAMFRTIAKDHAIKRLEAKPLARTKTSGSSLSRTEPATVEGRKGHGGQQGSAEGIRPSAPRDAAPPVAANGDTLRRPISRPTRIGTMLGTDHPRPREVPARHEPEGS